MKNTALFRWTLIAFEVFAGVMAVYGGVALLVNASGFGVREEWLRGSPFSDYRVPALGLLVFIAGLNLPAAALLWARREPAIALSVTAGVVLMGFELIETYSFGLRSAQQPLMFLVGGLVAGLALAIRSSAPGSRARYRGDVPAG